MTNSVSRRHVVQIALVIGAGGVCVEFLKRTRPVGRAVRNRDAVEEILEDGVSPVTGVASGSLRMAVFTDYQCPACRSAFPAMEAAVKADGDVAVVHKKWPIFGELSERAARVALASSAQGIYPAVHRHLMSRHNFINEEVMRNVVTDAGGNWMRAEHYMREREPELSAHLRANARGAAMIGLSGMPGFLAGSVLAVGAIARSDFSRLFSKAREPATRN